MRRLVNALSALPPLLSVAFVLHACGGGGGGAAPTAGDDAPFGLTQRVPLGNSLTFPGVAPNPGSLTAARAFGNLTFARPVFLGSAPDGSDRVFVVEQDGRILVFRNGDDVLLSEVRTFLDLRAIVGGPVSRAGNEEGLLGLAFDPEYATNRTFYVHYSAAGPRRSVFVRYQAQAADPNAADPNSAQIVLTVAQPFENHNGGWLGFGPDGFLYVALGDGGSGNDPQGNGQSLATLLGKILRLDVRGQATYAVPADNPFVGQPGALPEIWSLGWRNPWRCSFDRATGELWAGDVGQGAREEVDLVRRGANYGWRVYEGNLSNLNPTGLPPSAFQAPVIDYGRTLGTTVIGGYVYRGPSMGSLRGAYVYADAGSGRVWALVWNGTSVVSNTEVSFVAGIVSFGEDRLGELYAVSLNGPIYRFRETTPSPGAGVFPTTLSATGLFTDTANLVPNPGLVAYDVNAELWSDGALKRRWIAVPDGAAVSFAADAPWTFPQGTVLVKHFELELRVGDPSSRTRLETRVLILSSSGWAGYTYRWNPAGTDATLLTSAEVATYVVLDAAAPGGARDLSWSFPAGPDCQRCHTPAAGGVLGVRAGQLNREHDYAGVVDNQLRAWNHIGLFGGDIGPASAYGAWTRPSDATASAALRARAYMAANCAMCHIPGGPAPGGMDLRWGVPTALLGVVGVRPTQGDLGLLDPWRVDPFDRASSTLYLRVAQLGATRMPPLAHALVDPLGELLIGTWIDQGAE